MIELALNIIAFFFLGYVGFYALILIVSIFILVIEWVSDFLGSKKE